MLGVGIESSRGIGQGPGFWRMQINHYWPSHDCGLCWPYVQPAPDNIPNPKGCCFHYLVHTLSLFSFWEKKKEKIFMGFCFSIYHIFFRKNKISIIIWGNGASLISHKYCQYSCAFFVFALSRLAVCARSSEMINQSSHLLLPKNSNPHKNQISCAIKIMPTSVSAMQVVRQAIFLLSLSFLSFTLISNMTSKY